MRHLSRGKSVSPVPTALSVLVPMAAAPMGVLMASSLARFLKVKRLRSISLFDDSLTGNHDFKIFDCRFAPPPEYPLFSIRLRVRPLGAARFRFLLNSSPPL